MSKFQFAVIATTLIAVGSVFAFQCCFGQQSSTAQPNAQKDLKWTKSDKPYREIKEKIEKEIPYASDPHAFANVYGLAAAARPSDPMAQFAWACAEYEYRRIDPSRGGVPNDILADMEKADPGDVHEYSRLRFAITQDTHPNAFHPDLAAMGRRLLQYDPKDDFVKINLIYELGKSRESLPEALRLSKKWVLEEPANPKAHSTLAFVYDTMWDYTKLKEKLYAEKAVIEYKEYLRLAPAGDGFRKQAEHLIQFIQSNSK
jgi:hypothetical protein